MEKITTGSSAENVKPKPKMVFVNGPISPEFISNSISHHSTKKQIGAHSIFLGQVRNDHVDGKEVNAIEYSAYQEMAEDKFQEIREAAFAKFTLTCLHIYHSLGVVEAGALSLFVFASAVHRKEAIDACKEITERIKQEVPVWGKEMLKDNTYSWKRENE